MQISDRLSAIKTSPTMAVTARADELKAAGRDVIGLGAGEPDFPTPEHICAAAQTAIDKGATRYTAVAGTVELKKAIVDKFARENQLRYDAAQIVVSCGAKHSLYNLIHAIINPGDEVIIPAPYWVSYTDIVLMAGGRPVVVETGINAGFKMSPEQLEKAITAKTRLLILNSPSNPTGVCYRKSELAALGEVLKAHPQVMIGTDDIYEHIAWDDEPFANILNACPYLYERTIVVNGVSKAYAMTGWRIGFTASVPELASAMSKMQSQSTSNPCAVSQAASVAALNGDQSFMVERARTFKKRHDYVCQRLNNMTGVRCLEAQGAFYAFPDVHEAIARLADVEDDVGLCKKFLDEGEVAVVPGSAFGAPGYLRLSYATSDENLAKAMDRMHAVLAT